MLVGLLAMMSTPVDKAAADIWVGYEGGRWDPRVRTDAAMYGPGEAIITQEVVCGENTRALPERTPEVRTTSVTSAVTSRASSRPPVFASNSAKCTMAPIVAQPGLRPGWTPVEVL